MGFVMQHSDRVVVLHLGEVLAEGATGRDSRATPKYGPHTWVTGNAVLSSRTEMRRTTSWRIGTT